MTTWSSALASTIAVPSGVFIPVLKIGAAFGRFVGELTSLTLQGSVRFGTNRIPIIPGGYAVVAAAAFSGESRLFHIKRIISALLFLKKSHLYFKKLKKRTRNGSFYMEHLVLININ